MSLESSGLYTRIKQALGLSNPSEIARKLHLKPQSVYLWQKGNFPSLDTLDMIATVSGTSIHWLLTGEGPEQVKQKLEGLKTSQPPTDTDVVSRLAKIFPGMSVLQIAEALEEPENEVRSYMSGAKLPTTTVLTKIAARTGVSVTWLLTNRGPQWAAPIGDLGGEKEGVSQENGSSQPRAQSVGTSPEKKGTEDLLLAYMQLLVEQNNQIIQILRELVASRVGSS